MCIDQKCAGGTDFCCNINEIGCSSNGGGGVRPCYSRRFQHLKINLDFNPNVILYNEHYFLIQDRWYLMAQGSLNESGCSDTHIRGERWAVSTLNRCKEYCKDTKFLQYHKNGHCSCFENCDFQRPASEYGSKADVYEKRNSGMLSSMII